MHTIGLKCGSFAEGGLRGWGRGGEGEERRGRGRVGIWVFELSPRTRLSLVTAFLVASAARPTDETRVAVPQLAPQTQITALCAQTIIIIIKPLRVLTSALLRFQFLSFEQRCFYCIFTQYDRYGHRIYKL